MPKIGTRRQVWNGTAERTKYGLTKSGLLKNKKGKIVSKIKSEQAKKKSNLGKHLMTKGKSKQDA